MSSTPSPDRYGTARRRSGPLPWGKLLLTGLVVLAGIGIAYIGYTKFAVKDVEGKQIAFDIVDDRTMNIQFTVTRDNPSEPAVCIIRPGPRTARRPAAARCTSLRPTRTPSRSPPPSTHPSRPLWAICTDAVRTFRTTFARAERTADRSLFRSPKTLIVLK